MQRQPPTACVALQEAIRQVHVAGRRGDQRRRRPLRRLHAAVPRLAYVQIGKPYRLLGRCGTIIPAAAVTDIEEGARNGDGAPAMMPRNV